MLAAINPTTMTITASGRSLIPGVSSSKNRSSPALAAGIGASPLLLFSLLNFTHSDAEICMAT
jgi:hypothetical protein